MDLTHALTTIDNESQYFTFGCIDCTQLKRFQHSDLGCGCEVA